MRQRKSRRKNIWIITKLQKQLRDDPYIFSLAAAHPQGIGYPVIAEILTIGN